MIQEAFEVRQEAQSMTDQELRDTIQRLNRDIPIFEEELKNRKKRKNQVLIDNFINAYEALQKAGVVVRIYSKFDTSTTHFDILNETAFTFIDDPKEI